MSEKIIRPTFTLTQEETYIVERNLLIFFKSDKEAVEKILSRIHKFHTRHDNT